MGMFLRYGDSKKYAPFRTRKKTLVSQDKTLGLLAFPHSVLSLFFNLVAKSHNKKASLYVSRIDASSGANVNTRRRAFHDGEARACSFSAGNGC